MFSYFYTLTFIKLVDEYLFSPRQKTMNANAMINISKPNTIKKNARLNSDMIVQRDTLINANTFLYLGRNNYNKKQLARIDRIKQKQKLLWKLVCQYL